MRESGRCGIWRVCHPRMWMNLCASYCRKRRNPVLLLIVVFATVVFFVPDWWYQQPQSLFQQPNTINRFHRPDLITRSHKPDRHSVGDAAEREEGQNIAIEDDRPKTLEELELVYESRKELVKRVCAQRNIVLHPPVYVSSKNQSKPYELGSGDEISETPNTSYFALIQSHQTMGCFLNKVASSSLVTAFLQVKGYGPTFTSPHSMTSRLHPKDLEEFEMANATYFKFMFVRHPMERMLSCYMDKMVNNRNPKLGPYKKHVKKKAHEAMTKRMKNGQQRHLLFALPEKIPTTTTDGAVTVTTEVSDQNATENGPPVSFEEFLEFVLDSDLLGLGFDAHWVPFHRHCTPCSINFDMIGKLDETGTEDFEYVWRRSGLYNTNVTIPWFNQNTSPSKSKAKLDLEQRHYSSVPRDLIIRFYYAFRLDFEMFDYDINDTLLKAGYEPLSEDER